MPKDDWLTGGGGRNPWTPPPPPRPRAWGPRSIHVRQPYRDLFPNLRRMKRLYNTPTWQFNSSYSKLGPLSKMVHIKSLPPTSRPLYVNELYVGPKHIYRKIMMKIVEDKNLSSYITVFDVNWIDVYMPIPGIDLVLVIYPIMGYIIRTHNY